MPTRTQKRNRKKKAERRKKASETKRRQQTSATRKIQTAFRDYNKLDKCSICLLGVRPELKEYCHNFHPKCLAQWKASVNANRYKCPTCRQPLLSNQSSHTDLVALARNIQSKRDDLTVLIDDINYMEPDYLEYNALENALGARVEESMIQSEVFLNSVADGTIYTHPELANYYLNHSSAHLNQMDYLIHLLREELEVLQEVADIRATH
jgi:hypothetical protein